MPERPDRTAKSSDDLAPAPSTGAEDSARETASDDLANFEAFFHEHYGALCEYIRHIVHLPHVAEELAQDAFVSLWERHTRAPVQMAISYLYTTARNRAYSYLRHRRVVRSAARELALEAAERGRRP
jgi:DNA-directed RNA polymerase specialized sigma24 family protein